MLFRMSKYFLWLLVFLAILVLTLWGILALWYRTPFEGLFRIGLCAAFGLTGLWAAMAPFLKNRLRAVTAFALCFALLTAWWITLQPPSEGNWSPDVARQTTGQIVNDTLQLSNVRNFRWHDDGSYEEKWESQTYDLNMLATTDLFLSYWAGPEMAHFVLSFGFTDGRYLAWSIEVRRQLNGGFSPVADAFKTNSLVILAATELDVIALRTNVRKEDVRLFRLGTDPDVARKLLEEYVRDANQLAIEPQWYNSISTNCTTVVVKMLRAIGSGPSFDWRFIANGYLPEYGYEHGSLNTDYSIEELRELGSVSSKGQAHGMKPKFSEAIRLGVPLSR